MQEFSSMVNDLMALSRMASKFPDFDIAGKRMYLDKVLLLNSQAPLWPKSKAPPQGAVANQNELWSLARHHWCVMCLM
jgi:hypothetical protein